MFSCDFCRDAISNSEPVRVGCGHVFHAYCLKHFNLYKRPKRCAKCERFLQPAECRNLSQLDPILPERLIQQLGESSIADHLAHRPPPSYKCVLCKGRFRDFYSPSMRQPYALNICEHPYHLQCIQAWLRDGNSQCLRCDCPVDDMDRALIGIYPDRENESVAQLLNCPWSSDDDTLYLDSWSDNLPE